jgi:hypothetical protein
MGDLGLNIGEIRPSQFVERTYCDKVGKFTPQFLKSRIPIQAHRKHHSEDEGEADRRWHSSTPDLPVAIKRPFVASSRRYDYCGASDALCLDRCESIVYAVEREYGCFRPETDLISNLKKIASVGACHIRDAADLPFSPKETIIVELRDSVQMNSVDGYDTAFPQASERSDNDIAAGRVSNRPVQWYRYFVFVTSDPSGSE